MPVRHISLWNNCFGTYTVANGDKYVGEFKDDKRHGQGTYSYGPNSKWAGDKYVGEFKDDDITDKAPIPLPMGTNTLVSSKIINDTDKAPMPMPVEANTSVSTRMTKQTDKAHIPLPMVVET